MSARRVRQAASALGLVAACAANVTTLPAQRALPPRAVPLFAVDSLLAQGRLAAAEHQLYAAVQARPRAPDARGALGWYLASRARFAIAEVLLAEALRFGADSAVVGSARAALAPYAARHHGPAVTIPFSTAEDAQTLGRFEVRTANGVLIAVLDPNATGVAATSTEAASGVGRELWVGERRLPVRRVEVDPFVRPGELRVGFDVLIGHAPVFDERAGTLTLGEPAGDSRGPEVDAQVPFVLAMPGLWLVERPGVPPAAVESLRGRALVRGARWYLDLDRSVVVIER